MRQKKIQLVCQRTSKNRIHLPVEPKVTELLKELIKNTQKTDLNAVFQQAYRKYTNENLDTFKSF